MSNWGIRLKLKHHRRHRNSLTQVDLKASFQTNSFLSFFQAKKKSNNHVCILIHCHNERNPFIIKSVKNENKLISTSLLLRTRRWNQIRSWWLQRSRLLGENSHMAAQRARNGSITKGSLPPNYDPYFQNHTNQKQTCISTLTIFCHLYLEIASLCSSCFPLVILLPVPQCWDCRHHAQLSYLYWPEKYITAGDYDPEAKQVLQYCYAEQLKS